MATIRLSCPNWKEGEVTPATFSVPVAGAKPTSGK
jgi:hypothetical protein